MSTKEAVKHTPGPLYVDVRSGVAVISTKPTPNCLDGECDGEILRISGTEWREGFAYKVISDEQAANIYLWAAAPEMLKALKEAIELIEPQIETISEFEAEWNNDSRRWLARVEAVIAKAEGRS